MTDLITTEAILFLALGLVIIVVMTGLTIYAFRRADSNRGRVSLEELYRTEGRVEGMVMCRKMLREYESTWQNEAVAGRAGDMSRDMADAAAFLANEINKKIKDIDVSAGYRSKAP